MTNNLEPFLIYNATHPILKLSIYFLRLQVENPGVGKHKEQEQQPELLKSKEATLTTWHIASLMVLNKNQAFLITLAQ